MKMTRDHKLIFLIKKSIPLLALVSSAALADQMHYRNVITGERAQGLGGAYTGVADDASGVFYNPGGLAFAQSNDISGSANAFYSKKVTFKKAFLGVSDFVEESGGTFAPFFGVMQKLDKVLPGLVGGFAYYTLDTELKDQDDLKTNLGALQRFHRAANIRAATFGATGALGYRVSPSLGIGLSLGYVKADELSQVSQNYTVKKNAQSSDLSEVYMESVRESLVAHGAQVGFGIQWSPSAQVSMGAMVRSGSYASQKYSLVRDKLKMLLGDQTKYDASPVILSSDNPLGSMPLEMRAGVAWFASPRLLVTSDVDWHEGVSDMSVATEKFYGRESVLNYALGTEYYLTASIPFRFGLFTNYDATPTPTTSKLSQPDHIDYMGTSMFLAWAQPNSQISAGIVVQKGTGKSQKNATDSSLQDIDALAYTLGFSATHSF
jgi:long-subunit fatty acid transport protein